MYVNRKGYSCHFSYTVAVPEGSGKVSGWKKQLFDCAEHHFV